MAYLFAESQGRRNLKFGYSSQLRGGRRLYEGKIRLTVENGEFLGEYLQGRLPVFIVSKDTLTYKGAPHTTVCISTFSAYELETFMKAVEVTNIWSLRQQADRKEQEYKNRWEYNLASCNEDEPIRVEFKDEDDLPF